MDMEALERSLDAVSGIEQDIFTTFPLEQLNTVTQPSLPVTPVLFAANARHNRCQIQMLPSRWKPP